MSEFWENNFTEKQKMWGNIPSKSADIANTFFKQKGLKNILIPGIGYGRNAQVFLNNDMCVTGIETITKEFSSYGLLEIQEITENQCIFLIKCKKK